MDCIVKAMPKQIPALDILSDVEGFLYFMKFWELDWEDWSWGNFTNSVPAKFPMQAVGKYLMLL